MFCFNDEIIQWGELQHESPSATTLQASVAFKRALTELLFDVDDVSEGREVLVALDGARYRYDAVKTFCQQKMMAEREPLTNAVFAFQRGSLKKYCDHCDDEDCTMTTVRPCGHAVCRKKKVQHHCPDCKRPAVMTFTRDTLHVADTFVDAYAADFSKMAVLFKCI